MADFSEYCSHVHTVLLGSVADVFLTILTMFFSHGMKIIQHKFLIYVGSFFVSLKKIS